LRDEAVRRGVRIEQGKRFVSVRAEPSRSAGVTAFFEDGTEASADLLIGADGVHSRVRSTIDPNAPAPTYAGQLSVGGIADGAGLRFTPNTYQMIFGHRAFFGYVPAPTGEVYWFANAAEPEVPDRAELTDVATWKRRLSLLFAGDAGPALELIERTGRELAAYPIYDMPSVPAWHSGPIVLVGDAIHATSPSSGQGASLAMEDAVALAECLRDQSDTQRAFARYERLRRERVERVVRYSRRIGNTKVPGPLGRGLRDFFMPLALRVFARSSMNDWLYRYPRPEVHAS
jgi:2-polyprenyl-6-methoxyphenol hydroxylase-like FAD-dependent oxidoreductase